MISTLELVKHFRKMKRRHAAMAWDLESICAAAGSSPIGIYRETKQAMKAARERLAANPPRNGRGRPKFEGVIPPVAGQKFPKGTGWNGHTYFAQVAMGHGGTKYLGSYRTLDEADAEATRARAHRDEHKTPRERKVAS
jgi:hypothetical protein